MRLTSLLLSGRWPLMISILENTLDASGFFSGSMAMLVKLFDCEVALGCLLPMSGTPMLVKLLDCELTLACLLPMSGTIP